MPHLFDLPAEILDQIFRHLIPSRKNQNLAPMDRGDYDDLRSLRTICSGRAKSVAEAHYWAEFFLGTSRLRDGYHAELPVLSALSLNPSLAANIRRFGHARHNVPLAQTIEAFHQDAVQTFLDETYAEPFCVFIRNMFANAPERGQEVEEHGMYLAIVLVLTLAVNVETVTIEIMDKWPTAVTKLFAFSGAQILAANSNRQPGQNRGTAALVSPQGKLRTALWNLKSIHIPHPGDHCSYWTDYVSATYIAPLLRFPGLRRFSTSGIKWDTMIDRSNAWQDEDWLVPLPWNDEKYGDVPVKERFFLPADETWPAMKQLRFEHAESKDIDWEKRMLWPERKHLHLEHGIEDIERLGHGPRLLRLDSILPRFPYLESVDIVLTWKPRSPYNWSHTRDALRRHGANLRFCNMGFGDVHGNSYSGNRYTTL